MLSSWEESTETEFVWDTLVSIVNQRQELDVRIINTWSFSVNAGQFIALHLKGERE